MNRYSYRLVVTETYEKLTETYSFRPVSTAAAAKALYTSHLTSLDYSVMAGRGKPIDSERGKLLKLEGVIQKAHWDTEIDLPEHNYA